MDLKRWEKRVSIIDYRVNTDEEAQFVFEWVQNHPAIAVTGVTAVMIGRVFTFKATNKDIALFVNDINEYHAMNAKLEEMEGYYNEH